MLTPFSRRRPVRVGVVLLGLVALLLPLLTASPAQAARSITLVGHGYGHGHGMSQWGAYYRAQDGQSAAQILAFYYPGTEAGTRGGRVKVLISADTSTNVVVMARTRLKVKSLGNKRKYALKRPKARKWRLVPAAEGRKTKLAWRGKRGGWHTTRTLKGEAQFTAGNAPITLVTPSGKRAYRGVLRSARPGPKSRKRDTVNILTLEDYLRGVVPREVPALWPEAAVQAQAVAARTYAAFEMLSPLASHYQICDTTQCQVYGGYTDEHPAANAAIDATKGAIVKYDGAPAFTQFSASNGGWMSAGSQPYLVGGKDTADVAYRNWTATITARQLKSAFPGLGRLKRFKILSRDGDGAFGGRVTQVRLIFAKGKRTMSGDDFRFTFGLRSTLFKKS